MDEIRYGKVFLAQTGDRVAGLPGEIEIQAQPRQALRATNGGARKRGNAIARYPIQVVKTHRNLADAHRYVLDHLQAIAAEEATSITIRTHGATYTLQDAVVTRASWEPLGITTRWTYDITSAPPS